MVDDRSDNRQNQIGERRIKCQRVVFSAEVRLALQVRVARTKVRVLKTRVSTHGEAELHGLRVLALALEYWRHEYDAEHGEAHGAGDGDRRVRQRAAFVFVVAEPGTVM